MDKALIIEQFTRERYVLEGYILTIVRDHHLAEDVYQDVAVAVFEHLDRFDESRDFRAWVRGIARNKAKQALSKVSKESQFVNEDLDRLVETAYEEQDNEAWYQLSHYHIYLRHCVGHLTTMMQSIVYLRYQERLSIKKIAVRLSRSSVSVQVALSRSRKALKMCIQKQQLTSCEGA